MTQITATYLDHMGSDLTTVNAARVSFGKKSEWNPDYKDSPTLYPRDENLIKYLASGMSSKDIKKWKNQMVTANDPDTVMEAYNALQSAEPHLSPFGHAFASFHVKAPIFVARQLVKHKFLRWNEVSRRYVTSDIELYYPDFWRAAAENVKQGSSNESVKVNTYGTGVCVRCGEGVPRKSAGPRGKWCSERCRAAYRKEHDPDARIHDAKYNASTRGIAFDLRRGDITWVTHCPLLGVELDYSSSEGKNPDYSPSIDRIDSSKGYTKDNVWIISNKANRMKNDGSKDELVSFAKSLLLHFNGQVVPEGGAVEASCKHLVNHYNHLLDEGVAPEQARMLLPQNTMTEWHWSGSLDAFAAMCALRLKDDTQYETRLVAQQIAKVLSELFPVSFNALIDNL